MKHVQRDVYIADDGTEHPTAEKALRVERLQRLGKWLKEKAPPGAFKDPHENTWAGFIIDHFLDIKDLVEGNK